MEKKYFVRHSIETPNSLVSREEKVGEQYIFWKFKFNDAEVLIFDSDNGLFTDCYVRADSVKNAELLALTHTENIISMIDFANLSASSPARLLITYNASEGVKKREFKQLRYTPIPERNLKKIDMDIFNDVFSSLDKNLEAKILRGIHWLRKSLLEEKHIDKFIALWSGLESISERLCDYYEIPVEKRVFECSDCGHIFFDSFIKGVKELFIEEMNDGKQLFGRSRGLRNNVIHGNIPLDDKFLSKVKKYNPELLKLLIKGVGKVIPLKPATVNKILLQKQR